MTTLPQTTPVRVPPGLGTGLNFPIGGPPAGAALPGGMSGADVWRVIRGNMWLIILMLIISAGAGYGLHRWLLRYTPKFTAAGLLEIETSRLTNLVGNQVSDMADGRVQVELRTQAQRLQQESLFSEVFKKPDSRIRDTRWFKQFAQPTLLRGNVTQNTLAKDDLLDRFRVTPLPDSKLLQVTFTAFNPEDSRVVLEEIVEEHLRQDREAATREYNTQIRSLQTMSDTLKAELSTLERQIETQQASLTAQGMSIGRSINSVREIELMAIIQSRIKAMEDAAEAQQTAASVQQQLQVSDRLSIIEEAIDKDSELFGLQQAAMRAELDLEMTRDRMGPEHASVRQLERQSEVFQERIERRRAELRTKYRDRYVESVNGQAAQATARVKGLQDQEKKLRDEMSGLVKDLADLFGRQNREASLRQEKSAVDNKIRDMVALAGLQSSSRIKWVGQPQTPELPSFPKLKIILPLAIFIGLSLALGIAFLREFLNDTVRSPRDIARVGQMTLLGLICDEADDPQAANARLAIFDAPHSMTAEQFRQMRTRLNQAASLETTRSIMVTGPSPLDGKTTVAANLAAGLALNGRRILLVDGNFRRPELHSIFGVSNEGGFAEVLVGQSSLEQRVHATRIPNLAVLPSGAKPANVTELFESQLFTDFVENALQTYDHVIFDSGPLLVVSESAAMAPRVDGVITVVRAHAESRGLLQRMRDSLRQLKAEHVGVVLNAVRAQGGGYYGRSIKTYYDYQS